MDQRQATDNEYGPHDRNFAIIGGDQHCNEGLGASVTAGSGICCPEWNRLWGLIGRGLTDAGVDVPWVSLRAQAPQPSWLMVLELDDGTELRGRRVLFAARAPEPTTSAWGPAGLTPGSRLDVDDRVRAVDDGWPCRQRHQTIARC